MGGQIAPQETTLHTPASRDYSHNILRYIYYNLDYEKVNSNQPMGSQQNNNKYDRQD